MFALFCLLLTFAASVHSEKCQNYLTSIRPNLFREGDWIDQLRIFSGNSDYVSQFHPNETVSLFLAKYKTNCGIWDLRALTDDEFEFSKGYYERRFREHFYPFQVKIKRNSSYLKSEFFLEQRHCEYYVDLTAVVEDVNILRTDYSSFIIIHQCIDSRNYLMLLTRKTTLLVSEKIEFEQIVTDVMTDFKIAIENQTFWWPTTVECDKY